MPTLETLIEMLKARTDTVESIGFALRSSLGIDGGDLNGVSPAMDYLDLEALDGGEL